jgi:hypothetical protein
MLSHSLILTNFLSNISLLSNLSQKKGKIQVFRQNVQFYSQGVQVYRQDVPVFSQSMQVYRQDVPVFSQSV